MVRRRKFKRVTHVERAVAHVVRALSAGLVVTPHGASVAGWQGTYTCGPAHKAVGPSGFAVHRYHRGAADTWETATAEEAAAVLVARVGTTRAREGALVALRKAGRA